MWKISVCGDGINLSNHLYISSFMMGHDAGEVILAACNASNCSGYVLQPLLLSLTSDFWVGSGAIGLY